ncbi:hypothetical protein ZHAS_00018951 [Anopheles sinensis]|uniref:Uncharacterized protein n=1 Tax=Anopheles sinensis TaxID=74873 RepID=A0A084WK83_ANOSI|nr:hypothetical protein ZHAS_00018951 [Anopheles sinensis]
MVLVPRNNALEEQQQRKKNKLDEKEMYGFAQTRNEKPPQNGFPCRVWQWPDLSRWRGTQPVP